MRDKGHPDRWSISEVYIYRNDQNMIAIIAARPNNNNNFLSHEWNSAHLDYVKEKWMLSRF
jgi:hypothetical protein